MLREVARRLVDRLASTTLRSAASARWCAPTSGGSSLRNASATSWYAKRGAPGASGVRSDAARERRAEAASTVADVEPSSARAPRDQRPDCRARPRRAARASLREQVETPQHGVAEAERQLEVPDPQLGPVEASRAPQETDHPVTKKLLPPVAACTASTTARDGTTFAVAAP